MRRSPPSVKATHEGVRDPVALVVGDDLHAPFPVDADARVCGAQVDADHGAAGTFFSGRCCIGRRGHEEKQPGGITRNETRTTRRAGIYAAAERRASLMEVANRRRCVTLAVTCLLDKLSASASFF